MTRGPLHYSLELSTLPNAKPISYAELNVLHPTRAWASIRTHGRRSLNSLAIKQPSIQYLQKYEAICILHDLSGIVMPSHERFRENDFGGTSATRRKTPGVY